MARTEHLPDRRWFGTRDTLGWWHCPPDGSARGVVVVAPSLGAEQLWAYRALIALSEGLVDDGFAVLRFDWPGTAGAGGDLTHEWPPGVLGDALAEAVTVARTVGSVPVAAVGFRVGAAVVASAGARCHLDAAVCWDPPASLRAWLREQRSLAKVAVRSDATHPTAPSHDAPSLDLPGFAYPAGAADDGRAIAVDPTAPPAPRWALLHGPLLAPDLVSRAAASGAVTGPAAGSSGMLYHDVLPVDDVQAVRRYLDATLPRERSTVAPLAGREVLPLGGGASEQAGRVGPHRLAVVDCRPAATTAPPVVFVGTANEPSVGPGRMWVDLSRGLARSGRRAVRVDLSGIADSPAREGAPRWAPKHGDAPADLLEVVRWLDVPPADVTFVGSCSGAYNALEAATRLGGGTVVAVNPAIDGGDDPARLVSVPRKPLLRAADRFAPGHSSHEVPAWAWRLLHATHLQRSPAAGLAAAARAGVRSALAVGPEDGRRFVHRGHWIVERLEAEGMLELTEVPDLDHALLDGAARRIVHDLLRRQLGLPQPASWSLTADV